MTVQDILIDALVKGVEQMNMQGILIAALVAYLIFSGIFWATKMMDAGAEFADVLGLAGSLVVLGFMVGRIA